MYSYRMYDMLKKSTREKYVARRHDLWHKHCDITNIHTRRSYKRRIITFLSELKRCSLCLWLSSMPFHMARKNHRLLLSCSCRGEAKQSPFSISNAALALVLVVHPLFIYLLFIYLLLAFNFNYSIRRPPTHGTARPNL